MNTETNEKTSRKWVYVSNVIKEDEYSKWDGKIVCLGAGTGKGKTTFIINYVMYLTSCGKKKILYLCNRVALMNQIKEQNNISELEIASYQSLEAKLKKGLSIPEYDAFIMDECHYFLDDSAFNPYTDLVYWWLLKKQKHKTRVFMSATGIEVFSFIEKCIKELQEKDSSYNEEIHHIPDELKEQIVADYDYLDNIYWLHTNSDIVNVLNMIQEKQGERAIFFSDSLRKIKSINENKDLEIAQNDRWFYYSQNSKTSGRLYGIEADRINQIDKYINGSRRFLYTTIALDNGVDIKDSRVKHIICNIFDFNEVIQCFGRKRVQNKDDRCDFYVMLPTKRDLERKHESYQSKIKEIETFNEDPNKWEIEDNRRKNGRTTKSKLIYSDPNNLDENGRPTRTVNRLAERKIRTINRGVEYMLGIVDPRFRNSKYQDILIRKSGIDPSKAHDISELIVTVEKKEEPERLKEQEEQLEKQLEKLKPFIEKYCGEFLTKAKKRKLTQLCGVVTRAEDGIGSPKKINEFLENNHLMYHLNNKSTERVKIGREWKSKAAWKIEKIDSAV